MLFSKCVRSHMPSVVNNWFEYTSASHGYETSCSADGLLRVLSCSTKRYGKEAIINVAISSWNKIQKEIKSTILGKVGSSSRKK